MSNIGLQKLLKAIYIYWFDRLGDTYWIIPEAASTEDFMDHNGFIDGTACGLEKKYFDEMFNII